MQINMGKDNIFPLMIFSVKLRTVERV